MIKGHNTLACIIDELKPIFCLNKCGTYRVVIDNAKYTLIRYPLDKDQRYKRVSDISGLNWFKEDTELHKEIRKILAFRTIFCIKSNDTQHILFNEAEHKLYSYCELNTHFKDDKIVTAPGCIKTALYKKYFDTCSLESVIRYDMLHDSGYCDTDYMKLSDDVDYIIEHIDRDYMWLTANMIMTISGFL